MTGKVKEIRKPIDKFGNVLIELLLNNTFKKPHKLS